MNLIAEPILKLFRKSDVPKIEVGDVVRVHQKIREGNKERIQVFEGIVIATNHGVSANASFTVRKIASGIGVEKVFLLHSPNVVKVEFKQSSNAKRSKLYFLRALTGKALKLKGSATKKEAWAEVLGQETEAKTEATEEDIAEAVKADEEKKAAEVQVEPIEEVSNIESAGSDVVETPVENESPVEVNDGTEKQNSGEEQTVTDESDAGAGNDAEGSRS
jgi:large subunit ribosomal protein L19